MKEYIINSKQWGVYLGSCMGLGFWSKLDAAGQISACTFESPEEAQKHINTWESKENLPGDFEYLEVEIDNVIMGASIEQCVKAGAERWEP